MIVAMDRNGQDDDDQSTALPMSRDEARQCVDAYRAPPRGGACAAPGALRATRMARTWVRHLVSLCDGRVRREPRHPVPATHRGAELTGHLLIMRKRSPRFRFCTRSSSHRWNRPNSARSLPPTTSRSSRSAQLRAVIRDRQAEQRATRLDNRPVAVPLPMQRSDVDDDDTCRIVVGDAARMSLPDGDEHSAACQPASCPHVALAVTSPPYCLGIQEQGYIDFTVYADYLAAAATWAAELYRVLQPNGRLALNVPVDIARGQREALACDWLQILRAAGFRYRTTIVWAEGNISRSTARGSIDSPSAINLICPAEVVLVVHKGEWNLGRTDPSDLEHDEWLAWTLAAWSFPGEHAERVGYPAAFPEELPRRLIKLLSFPGDLVIDPFVGSGTTAVVARCTRPSFLGLRSQSDRCSSRARKAYWRPRPAVAGPTQPP